MRLQLLQLLQAQRGLLLVEASQGVALAQQASRAAASHLLQQVPARQVSTSAAPAAAAAPANVSSLVSSLSDIVASDAATPADVADAALALSYLQLSGQRRTWGVVLEKASDLKAGFQPASLTALLWAITSSGVEHGRTLFELSGTALKLLGSLSPAQVAVAAEAFGKAGVKDAELFDAIATKVTASIGDYTPSQLASVLWGLAAAGTLDSASVAAISAKLAASADQLSASDAAQVTVALAKLKRADKPTLDAVLKAAAPKLGRGEPVVHAVQLLWGAASLGYAPAGVAAKAAAAVKAGAAGLGTDEAVTAAWSLAVLGAGDNQLQTSLLTAATSGLAAAPEALPFDTAALLFEALALSPEVTVAQAAASYTSFVYSLVRDQRKLLTPEAVKGFKAELAEATAFAAGARYRPEIEAAVAAFPRDVTAGLSADIVLDLGSSKVIVEAVDESELTSTLPATPLGSVTARAKVAEAAGFKLVAIPQTEFSLLSDVKARAKYVLSAIRKAVPGASGVVDPLVRKVDAPVA